MQIPIFRGGGCVKKVKLGEICEIVTGSTPKSSNPNYWNGEYKWITPAEISDDDFIVFDTQRKITKLGIEKTGLKSFPKGTVLLSSRAPIGKVAISGCEMYCNQGFKNFICSNKINNEYLYYFLKSKKYYLNVLGRGATFKEISKSIVSNIEISLPTYDIQRKKVKVLKKIDKLIDTRKEQLIEFKYLVKSRFNEMFGDPVFNEMRWRRCKLKDISIGKLAYGSGASAIDFSGLRYIRITDIDECGNLKLDKKSPSHYDEKYLLNTGDILFARSGATVGKTFLYSKEKYGPALYAGYLIRLIPNLSLVNPVFVYHFTNTKFYNDFIAKVQNTVAQPNINAKQYSELDFILPPLSLQNEFADFVAQVDKSQLAIQKSLEELETLKKSLMQEYFG